MLWPVPVHKGMLSGHVQKSERVVNVRNPAVLGTKLQSMAPCTILKWRGDNIVRL